MPPLLLGEDSAPPGLEVPPAGGDDSSEDGFGVDAFGAGLEVPPPEPECMCTSELAFGAGAGACSTEEPPEGCDTGTLAAGAFAGVLSWVVACVACFLAAMAAGVVAVGVLAAAATAGVVAGVVAELDLLEPPHPATIAATATRAVASAGARNGVSLVARHVVVEHRLSFPRALR